MKLSEEKILVIVGTFPNVQKSKFHILATDERQVQVRKIQSDSKTQYRVKLLIISQTSTFSEEETWDLHLESSRPDLKISKIQTLQHSTKDLSNGLWVWKKKQGHLLGSQERVQHSSCMF